MRTRFSGWTRDSRRGRHLGRPFFVFAFTIVVFVALAATRTSLAVFVEGAKQIVDNERVTVWDVIWSSGHGAAEPRPADTVTVALNDGPIRVVDIMGTEKTITRNIGDVQFEARGEGHREDSVGAAVPHDILIELKDTKVAPLANTSGYPNAFPRPGSRKIFENTRVLCWDYTWTPGVATPMHFHDKDVVVVYLETGVLASTTPDKQVVNNPHYFGFTKFNSRDRSHTETLIQGKGRAIIVELK
jgi:hypothetical protein